MAWLREILKKILLLIYANGISSLAENHALFVQESNTCFSCAPRVFPKKMVPRFIALCLSVLLHLSVGARSSSGYLCGGRAGVGPALTEAPRVARIPPGEEPASVPDSLWVELRWGEPENADAVERYMVGVTMEEDGLKGRERVVYICSSTVKSVFDRKSTCSGRPKSRGPSGFPSLLEENPTLRWVACSAYSDSTRVISLIHAAANDHGPALLEVSPGEV